MYDDQKDKLDLISFQAIIAKQISRQDFLENKTENLINDFMYLKAKEKDSNTVEFYFCWKEFNGTKCKHCKKIKQMGYKIKYLDKQKE